MLMLIPAMNILLVTAIALFVVFCVGWMYQIRSGNAGYVDVLWALGVGGTALVYFSVGEGDLCVRTVAGLLMLVWSLRLAYHLHHRVSGQEEDGRYQALRSRLGANINRFHFFFFQGQALLAWLFALPAWVIASNAGSVPVPILIAAALVGAMALLGEAIADKQLSDFRANPNSAGKTCRTGLWRYSRHPNYFFEWMHWLSYPLLAWGAVYVQWLWLAPAMMFLFLWFVTGIPYTEKQAVKSRGDDYRRYQRETSVFFPWPPRRDGE